MSRNEISDLRLDKWGFVFQQMYMLKNLSVYDNIILPAYQSVKGRTKQEEKKSMPMPQSSCRSLASVKLRITM